jgi:arylsulfatase A-like enzyme
MNFYGSDKVTKIHCDKFNPGVHSTELLTDTAINWLDKRNASDKPFFLYLAYLAPHDPRTMPERFLKMYDPEKISLPKNIMGGHPFSFGVEDARDEKLMPWPREEDEIRRQLAAYYAMVSHLDFELGRLLDSRDRSGQLKDTSIVFTSDNGLAAGCHGLLGKQNVYDHSVRVPLIFSGPGIPKGQIRNSFVYLHDIYPTLMDLCSMDTPASVEGKSFIKMFDDPNYRTRETLYFAYKELIRSVKDSRYKLIEYRNHAKKTQLFDLADNPEETVNLAQKKEHTATIKKLREHLLQYRYSWEDTGHKYSKAFWDAYDTV